MNPRYWTAEQDRLLRSMYLQQDIGEIEHATGKSRFAIYCRAKRLDIVQPQAWSNDHLLLIEVKWGVWTIKRLAAELGRTPGAVHYKAYELGLELGCPDGYAYVKQAADHFGYSTDAFTNILRWAKVPRRESLARPVKPTRAPWRIVNMELAAKAVDAWLKTEAVKPAARARGISHGRIYRILARYGQDLPRRPRHGKKWNIPSVVIDAAVEAWRRDVGVGDIRRAA